MRDAINFLCHGEFKLCLGVQFGAVPNKNSCNDVLLNDRGDHCSGNDVCVISVPMCVLCMSVCVCVHVCLCVCLSPW